MDRGVSKDRLFQFVSKKGTQEVWACLLSKNGQRKTTIIKTFATSLTLSKENDEAQMSCFSHLASCFLTLGLYAVRI